MAEETERPEGIPSDEEQVAGLEQTPPEVLAEDAGVEVSQDPTVAVKSDEGAEG